MTSAAGMAAARSGRVAVAPDVAAPLLEDSASGSPRGVNAIATPSGARAPRFAWARSDRPGAAADAADCRPPPAAPLEPARVRRPRTPVAPGLRRALALAVVAAHGLIGYALLQSSSAFDTVRVQRREIVVPVSVTLIEPAPPPRERTRAVDPPPAPRRRASPPPAAPVTEAVVPLATQNHAPPVTLPPTEAPAPAALATTVAAAGGESSAAPPAAPAPRAEPAPAPEPSTVTVQEVGYLTPPRLSYPPLSRRLGEEGRVTLRVWVDADGRPGRILVSISSGYSRLDEAAVEAARATRFRPYLVAGVAQPVWVLVPFVFRLDAAS